MIQGITENNFPPYATLHEATVTLNDMGERIIETQIRIDGDIVPEFGVRRNGTFYPMSLTFKNEVFVLPNKTPTASKDNSTRNSIVTLTFRSEVIEDLKRYFFFMPSPKATSTAVAEKYNASVRLTLTNFVAYMRTVLRAYFGASKYDVRFSGIDDGIERLVEIDYAKLWDVLTKIYDIFGKRWSFTREGQTTYIDIGGNADTLDEHLFQYGYDGGLMKFERNTNEDEITNVLLGRGGERNVPRLYFKDYEKFHPGDSRYSNNGFTPDPDALWELENVYFDRIRDLNFRWYVRGWMQNPNRVRGAWTYPTYQSIPSEYQAIYYKGTRDTTFNPIEYVEDSVSKREHGEHWGALEDNDNIYPTIQGMSDGRIGDYDELVDAEIITSDDVDAGVESSAYHMTLKPMVISLVNDISGRYDIPSEVFTIPSGKVGLLNAKWVSVDNISPQGQTVIDTASSSLTVKSVDESGEDISKEGGSDGFVIKAIPPGTYRLNLHLELHASTSGANVAGTYGLEGIVITTTKPNVDAWKPTFEVWVKNIWNTEFQQGGETEQQYAERVWLPILGDRDGNEAAMVFTSGALSVASDYEFVIAGIPEYDTTKEIQCEVNGVMETVPSEWKITLYKSNAEYEVTGNWIPSTKAMARAGDHFFFIGIDIPNTYVLDAERRLHIYKEDALKTMKDVFPTWTITLDKVRVHTLEDDDAGLNKKLADVLSPGMKIKISDPRFTKGDQLTLYIQSIIYRWAEPTKDSPYIVPDIELTLSDKVVSQQSAFSKMQFDVKEIGSSYVREIDVEEIVRKVAGELFLKKTGEADESLSPTKFASSVTSNGFRQGGVGGTGWGLYRTNAAPAPATIQTQAPEGESVIEVDRCIVRKELEVNTLVVNQISSRGGKEILSAASITVTKVIEGGGGGEGDERYYDCYFDQKQGSVANLFEAGDIAFCQVFKTDTLNDEGGILLRYYKAVVSAVGIDYIRLDTSRWEGAYAVPQVGDVIVQYGNISKAERQFVIIRDVVGGGYEQMISGLTGGYDGNDEESGEWLFSNGVEYYFAGKTRGHQTPRWFIGNKVANQSGASGQYIEYANGHLTIMGSASVSGVSGSTEIAGNLIQTGEISLGDRITGDNLRIWSGISGRYDGSVRGNGIAAWYGGEKIDGEVQGASGRIAKSLFRFDGSGYLAGGNITWNAAGYGSIPGVSWRLVDGQNVVTIDGDVKLESSSGDTVTSLINAVRDLNSMFTLENTGTDADPVYRIKANYGLYSVDYLAAGGIGQSGGGGEGSVVVWNQLVLSGTKIATITINGNSTDVYAPSGGGGTVSSIRMNGRAFVPDNGVIDLGTVITSHQDISGKADKVTSATAGNVAIFASDGGVADSGIHNSALALLPSDNQFTGKNTFAQSIWTHGVVLTDYSDAIYGRTGATNYAPIFRIYTNSADGKGDLNFGIDPGAGGTATHDVNFIGASIRFRNKYWSDTNATLLALTDLALYAYRNIEPGSATLNLGASSLRWNNLYLKRWYPKQDDTSVYVEYDAATDSFYFHGNIIASGFITAGDANPNA